MTPPGLAPTIADLARDRPTAIDLAMLEMAERRGALADALPALSAIMCQRALASACREALAATAATQSVRDPFPTRWIQYLDTLRAEGTWPHTGAVRAACLAALEVARARSFANDWIADPIDGRVVRLCAELLARDPGLSREAAAAILDRGFGRGYLGQAWELLGVHACLDTELRAAVVQECPSDGLVRALAHHPALCDDDRIIAVLCVHCFALEAADLTVLLHGLAPTRRRAIAAAAFRYPEVAGGVVAALGEHAGSILTVEELGRALASEDQEHRLPAIRALATAEAYPPDESCRRPDQVALASVVSDQGATPGQRASPVR